MQKAKTETNSEWQQKLKKEAQKEQFKKYGIWAAIILASILGLAGLVRMAGTSSPSQTPVEVSNLPAVSSNDIVIGSESAELTITEYADFQCPACASYNPIINKLLSDYDGRVRVVYRHFPLRGVHRNALISGRAAYAANEQNKFSEMKDLLFDNQADWENLGDPRQTFEGYAKQIGLDVEMFRRDMNSKEAESAVLAGEREAMSLGLNSTPSFFVGNKRVAPQGYDAFKRIIEEELKN